jgi:hypothetical protein
LVARKAANQGSTISEENEMNADDFEPNEKIDREIVREEERVLSPEERFRIVLEKRLKKKNS